MPGVHTSSEDDSRFRRLFVELANKHCPQDNLDDGQPGKMKIHASWDRLLVKPGYDQAPITLVPKTNEPYLKSIELPIGPRSDRDVAIFDKGIDLALRTWVNGSFRAKNNSSEGFPSFRTDGIVKRDRAVELLGDKVFPSILRLVGRGDARSLAKDYKFFIAYMMQVRRQVDSPSKVRMIVTRQSMRDGSFKRSQASKIITGMGHMDGFSRMRARPVQGLTWSANCMLQAAASGHMRHLFDNYAFTFKHTTKEQVCDKLDAADAEITDLYGDCATFFGDVSDYDGCMRQWMFDRFHLGLAKYYDQDFVKLSDLSQKAPYFIRPFELDGDGDPSMPGMWVGNPMNFATFVVCGGLRSGIAWVSFIGKLFKFLESACVWDAVTGDVLEDLENYMLGKRALRQLNAGDDTIELGPKKMMEAVSRARSEGIAGYFNITPESGQGFIGSLYWKESGRWKATARIMTMYEKRIGNEHDVSHKFRERWPLGEYVRATFYGEAPAYDLMHSLWQHCWRNIMEPKFGSYDGIVSRAYEDMKVRLGVAAAETAADMAVLMNPDALHHRVTEQEVSDKVLDTISTRIPESSTYSFISKIYEGHIQ